MIFEKVTDFIDGSLFSDDARRLAMCLIRPLVKVDPITTLHHLLPKTCQNIENTLNHFKESSFMNQDEDIELSWYLNIFAVLLESRGDTLLIYKQKIVSTFQQLISVVQKNSVELVVYAAYYMLQSLCQLHPIVNRSAIENIDESFVKFLPIQVSLVFYKHFYLVSQYLKMFRPGVNISISIKYKFNFMFQTWMKLTLLVNLSTYSSLMS